VTRLVWLPEAHPAVIDGPRCADCPHVWSSKDNPGLVLCVAFDEPLRPDARRRLLRGPTCRTAESKVGSFPDVDPDTITEQGAA
jgi:hypothetical protein